MTDQFAGINIIHILYYTPEDDDIKVADGPMTVDEYSEFSQALRRENDVTYIHAGRRLFDDEIDYDTMELISNTVTDDEVIPNADPNPKELARAKQRFAHFRKKLKIPDPPVRAGSVAPKDKVLVRNIYPAVVYAQTAVSPDGSIVGRIPKRGKAFVSKDEARQLKVKDLVVQIVE